MTSLQELNLSHNKIEGPFEMSVFLCRLTQLRKIDLSHNQICLVSISQIGFQLPNLHTLNLSHNRISDITIGSGSVQTTGEKALPALVELLLDGNPMLQNSPQVLMHKFPQLGKKREVPEAEPEKQDVEQAQVAVHQTVSGFTEFGKSGHTAAKKKAAENAVIKIIQKEWDREMERLDIKKNG